MEINLQASGEFISPDDARIAFTKPVAGQVTHGLFIARLGGTERSLIVQLDHWAVGDPVRSPYGERLIVTIINTDGLMPMPTPVP